MKTFRQIINEIAEPKGGDEKRFKDKHIVAKYSHPKAEDGQFVAKNVKKDKSKAASYEEGEDEEVYEEVEQIDEDMFTGLQKLKDGSSVKISKEDNDVLTTLFKELKGSNREKMKEKMMSGKKGYNEILAFAREAT